MMHLPRQRLRPSHCPSLALLALAGALGCESTRPPTAPSTGPPLAMSANARATITLLNALPGATNMSETRGISGAGQIVGRASVPDFHRYAAIWEGSTDPTLLGDLPGVIGSMAWAITPNGTTVVGEASDGTQMLAIRWVKSAGSWVAEALPHAPLTDSCQARDVTSDGSVIVGYCLGNFVSYAVFWKNGVPERLDPQHATLAAVNDLGQAVGTIDGVAARWDLSTGDFFSLGTLGGTESQALGINDAGAIVGWAALPSNASRHAFIYTDKKGMVDLGTPDGPFSRAQAINEAGQIVGEVTVGPNSAVHAFLWHKSKSLDLGAPDNNNNNPEFSSAFGLNEVGQIVGTSLVGSERGTLWTLP